MNVNDFFRWHVDFWVCFHLSYTSTAVLGPFKSFWEGRGLFVSILIIKLLFSCFCTFFIPIASFSMIDYYYNILKKKLLYVLNVFTSKGSFKPKSQHWVIIRMFATFSNLLFWKELPIWQIKMSSSWNRFDNNCISVFF